VPVAAFGVFVHVTEVRAIGGIHGGVGVIAPTGADSLCAESSEHDGLTLREVTWRVIYKTSRIPNGREDCGVGSRITDGRVSILIDSYAGHPAP